MEKQLTDKSLVPVAYQVRMSDGRWGTIFHHPDKPLGDHRPLYAHPTQPSEAVVVAAQALGSMPEGYCFCSTDRIGDDSKAHEPECADLRAALAAMEASPCPASGGAESV